MADTTNYGWTKPVEGASTGVWDTILNAALDDIDTDVFGVDGRVADLEASVPVAGAFARPLIIGASGAGFGWVTLGISGFVSPTDGSTGSLNVPLPHLRPGMRITGFESFARSTSGTLTCSLRKTVAGEAGAQVSAGHTVTGTSSETLDGTTGLEEDVTDDTAYYIRFTQSGNGAEVVVTWVRVTVEATPE
jgi:hypothetical protein